MPIRQLGAPVLLPLAVLASLASPSAAAAASGPLAPPPGLFQPAGGPDAPIAKVAPGAEKNPKLSSHLLRLADADRAALPLGHAVTAADLSGLPADLRALVEARLMRIDAAGNVQVYLRPSAHLAAAEAVVRQAGGQVERSSAEANLVQARVPLARLAAIGADPAVEFVRLPDYGDPQVGAVTTEGDSILETNLLRSTFGIDGSGVRVGVISDGVGGSATSASSGDLPAVINTTTCNVAGGNPASSGAEGTAMLEIVHDLAPGAELWFGHFSTSLDFNAAVSCLAANTDVVVDDISFFNVGPYDGSSFISAHTASQLTNPGTRVRAYATSAGNQALAHYGETFRDSGFILTNGGHTYKVHQFAATAKTTDAGFGLLCATGSSPLCGNAVAVHAGATVSVFLSWDDPFGAATDDYDLFIFDNTTGTIIAHSANPQTGHQDPTEALSFKNNHADGLFSILIGLRSGVAKRFSLYVPSCSHGGCFRFTNGTELNFNTVSGSVSNQGDAGGGVLTVGAIGAHTTGDPNHFQLEPYSSQGPTADGRIKPDITAIDGVKVTGNGGFAVPFFGTSAAAPHIAGIAALLLQLRPDFKAGGATNVTTARSLLSQATLASAVALGAPGKDNAFGTGRANAFATGELLALPAGACVADATTLCIDDTPHDSRWRIKVLYDAGNGLAGSGDAIPLASLGVTQGGLFWFFNPSNPEMLIKVLNACSLNNSFWVFSAAGTNVGLTTIVDDTKTGRARIYTNPNGTAAPPVQDTSAFACQSGDLARREAPLSPSLATGDTAGTDGTDGNIAIGGCTSNATALCIDGRYSIEVAFATGSSSGFGQAIPLTSLGITEGGLFWFFSSTNPEMLVKVLNGCAINNHHWVFFSAGTNVGLAVTVTDTLTGAAAHYTNTNGTAAVPVQDTSALPCP